MPKPKPGSSRTRAAAKAACDDYASLQGEKARLDRELAAFLGPGGAGLEREIGEAKAAQQEAVREVERLTALEIAPLESGEATGDAGRAEGGASERLRRISSRVSVALRDVEEGRREREEVLDGRTRQELTRELFARKDELANASAAMSVQLPVAGSVASRLYCTSIRSARSARAAVGVAASVGGLLGPVADLVPTIDPWHAEALSAVFADGPAPSAFALGRAVHRLLAEAARGRPRRNGAQPLCGP